MNYWTVQEETVDALVKARKPYGFYDWGCHPLLHLPTWTRADMAYEGITNCYILVFQIAPGQIPLERAMRDATPVEKKVLKAS